MADFQGLVRCAVRFQMNAVLRKAKRIGKVYNGRIDVKENV